MSQGERQQGATFCGQTRLQKLQKKIRCHGAVLHAVNVINGEPINVGESIKPLHQVTVLVCFLHFIRQTAPSYRDPVAYEVAPGGKIGCRMQEVGLARSWASCNDQQRATRRNAALEAELTTSRTCPPIPWADCKSGERQLSLGVEEHGAVGQ